MSENQDYRDNMNRIYKEVDASFLDEPERRDFDPTLFDRMNADGKPAAHFDHEQLRVATSEATALAERTVTPEISPVEFMQATGVRLEYERKLKEYALAA